MHLRSCALPAAKGEMRCILKLKGTCAFDLMVPKTASLLEIPYKPSP